PGPSHFLPIINPPSLATNPYSNYSSIALVTHTGFSGTVNFTATITPNPPNAPTAKVNPSNVTENLPKDTYTDVSWVVVPTTSIVSGPSPTALQATLNPSTFPLPYVLPGPQQLETTLTVSASPTAAPGNYVLRISSTNGTITGTVDIPVTITAAPVSSIPGV